jgi:hypothetical protein
MITVTKQIRVLALAGALTLAAQYAAAQSTDPKLFVNASVGVQVHTHSIGTGGSQSIYDETATFASSQEISGGPLVDFGAAYQITPMVAAGVSVSSTSDTETAAITASVPSPIFYNQFATITSEQGSLHRRETAVHVQVKLTIPTGAMLPEGAKLALVVGPSFIHLSQDLISAISISGTQGVEGTVENQTGSGVGLNGGFELRIPVSGVVGVGGFVRYAGGKVDLPSVTGMKVGGFQAAGSVILGF